MFLEFYLSYWATSSIHVITGIVRQLFLLTLVKQLPIPHSPQNCAHVFLAASKLLQTPRVLLTVSQSTRTLSQTVAVGLIVPTGNKQEERCLFSGYMLLTSIYLV